MQIRLILLDFDGTLADTRRANTLAYVATLREAGYTLTEEEYAAKYFGMRCNEFLTRYGIADPGERERLRLRKIALYPAFFDTVRLNRPLWEFCRQFRAQGGRVWIVSTGSRANIDNAMRQLGITVAGQLTTQLQQAQQMGMTEQQIAEAFAKQMSTESEATYDGNMTLLGVASLDEPSMISIYPKNFDAKEKIEEIISTYNDKVKADGNENLKIEYTDIVGLMMTSVSTIIDAISVILIAFVAISLVVSSIMIGIITYISVLERTKEIGILRAMGASKRDISRVFNAETLIVGFAAGAIGIGVTLLLLIPANAIVYNLTGISGMCVLPWQGAVILVIISMLLTLIAGLIPSHYAAKKDPVLALRSE